MPVVAFTVLSIVTAPPCSVIVPDVRTLDAGSVSEPGALKVIPSGAVMIPESRSPLATVVLNVELALPDTAADSVSWETETAPPLDWNDKPLLALMLPVPVILRSALPAAATLICCVVDRLPRLLTLLALMDIDLSALTDEPEAIESGLFTSPEELRNTGAPLND